MLAYPASLPLSRGQLSYVAALIWRHRVAIGSVWRKLGPGKQALLVLAHLYDNGTFAGLAAGFGVGTSTAWRYVQEGVRLLAEQAPSLVEALWQASWSGSNFVFVDGTVVPIDRVRGVPDRPAPADQGKGPKARILAAKARAEQQRRRRLKVRLKGNPDPAPTVVSGVFGVFGVFGVSEANLNRLYYSGKHKQHVVTLQGLVDPHGRLVWVSDGLPGSTQDLAAAHAHGVIELTNQADLYVVADLAYVGPDQHVLTGYRKPASRQRSPGQKAANHALASIRAKAEHGFAPFKRWRILHKARCCPRRIGRIAKAIHTLLTRVQPR